MRIRCVCVYLFVCVGLYVCVMVWENRYLGRIREGLIMIVYCVASAPIKLWKEEEITPCEIFYVIHQDIAIIQHLTKYAQNNLTILYHIITNAVILI